MGEKQSFGLVYYTKAAVSGGACCSLTHSLMCPVDVVKTRIQLDPVTYNRGLLGGIRQVIANEGVSALATGLGATAGGYFMQGWFKFGGVELLKIKAAESFGEKKAYENRLGIYLGAAAAAEFVADIFLCPFEAARIGAVQNPKLGGFFSAAKHIKAERGLVNGFYSGFVPMLFKQIPYTMAKFAVQGMAAEQIAKLSRVDIASSETSQVAKLTISLSSGVIAGVAAAIISHPADTMLSLVNKPGEGGNGSMVSRLINIAKEQGLAKLALNGLGARCVMIGSLTALQFVVFDSIMSITGAKKFHFHAPAEEKASSS